MQSSGFLGSKWRKLERSKYFEIDADSDLTLVQRVMAQVVGNLHRGAFTVELSLASAQE